MTAVFFSASWQYSVPCLPRPDKNSSTSVRREPNIGVRRSRTTMGDRCISMPTMFSVPGGTPSAGIAKGSPLAGFLGTLSPQKEFPWGSGGRSAPAYGRRAAGPHGSGGAAAHPRPWQRASGSHLPASAGKKRQAGRRPTRERRLNKIFLQVQRGRRQPITLPYSRQYGDYDGKGPFYPCKTRDSRDFYGFPAFFLKNLYTLKAGRVRMMAKMQEEKRDASLQ